MDDFFEITLFPSKVNPIHIVKPKSSSISVRSFIKKLFSNKLIEMTNDDDEKYYDDDDKENNEKKLIEFKESLLLDFPPNLRQKLSNDNNDGELYCVEENNEEEQTSTADVFFRKEVITMIQDLYNIMISLTSNTRYLKLKNNLFYHLGWKQLYNKYIFLDIDQKERKWELFPKTNPELTFYPLDKLISLLKTDNPDFTMTTFAFILFSVTKSLYKIPKNSSVKDIKLSVLVNDKSANNVVYDFLKKVIKAILEYSVSFDYSNGHLEKNPVKEYQKYCAEKRCTDNYIKRINHTSYIIEYVDYPIIVNKKTKRNYDPNPKLNSLSASPIFINYIDTSPSKKSMFIPVYPQSNISYNDSPIRTGYLLFLESKLSSLADDEFISKGISDDLSKKISDIFTNEEEFLLSLSTKEMSRIENCIFKLFFHKNQKVTYFDDLYAIAKKQLSFPNSDPERVRIYSYLLASLMSFKEYVDELPTKDNYYAEENETSYSDNDPIEKFLFDYGSYKEYSNYIDKKEQKAKKKTKTSTSIDIDITPYKQEFYDLFDQTVEIFKKRCAADNNADINISYDDKLIQLFDCFITKLINEDSNIIIKPAKTKQGLIFLDFHSYFEHFELFLEKQNFHYSISKQKFNRLLYDNKILKPRYNGSDKTPPKLDYILQINEQKYTVLAIKLDILKAKISELSK